MADLVERIDKALTLLGRFATGAPSVGSLEATILPQVALLRHARGLATQDPSYADSTSGALVAGLVDALVGTAPRSIAPRSDLAARATASWAAVPITNSRAA